MEHLYPWVLCEGAMGPLGGQLHPWIIWGQLRSWVFQREAWGGWGGGICVLLGGLGPLWGAGWVLGGGSGYWVGNTRPPGSLDRGGAIIQSGILCPFGEGAPAPLGPQKPLGCLRGLPCPPQPPSRTRTPGTAPRSS